MSHRLGVGEVALKAGQLLKVSATGETQFALKLAPANELSVDQGLTLSGIPPHRRVRLDLVVPS